MRLKQLLTKTFPAILCSSAALYISALSVLALIANPLEAHRQRLNFLPESRLYPLQYSQGKAPFNQAQFIFSLQYFETVKAFTRSAKYKEFSLLLPQTEALIGFCYYYLGDYSKAERAYQKATQRLPSSFWNYANLGTIYFQQKRYSAAIEQLKQAQRRYQEMLGNISTAPSLDKNLAMLAFPEYIKIRKQLTLSYFYLENYQEMLSVAASSSQDRIDPQQTFFAYYAGVAAFHLKDPALAAAFFTQAIEKDKRFLPAYEFLIRSAEALGQKTVVQTLQAQTTALRKEKTNIPSPAEGLLDLSIDPVTNMIPFLH